MFLLVTAITGIAISSDLMDFYCSHEMKTLQFWGPPAFVAPLPISLFVSSVNRPSSTQNTRLRQMAVCFLPALIAYYFYAYIFKTFNYAFFNWALMSVAGLVDFQVQFCVLGMMKQRNYRLIF